MAAQSGFRFFTRTRAFPAIAWAYLAALAIQVFFAGMYVFVGASNIALHLNMAHVIGLLSVALIAAALIGRVGRTDRRLAFALFGLLLLQGLLVIVGKTTGVSIIAALHPVNALVLTYTSLRLAQRSNAYWSEARRTDAPAAPSASLEGVAAGA